MTEYLIHAEVPVNVYLTIESDSEEEARKILDDYLSEGNYEDFDLDVADQIMDYLDNLDITEFNIKEDK